MSGVVGQSVAANSAGEQRYRVGLPNSRPRSALLIGLDPAARHLVERLVAREPGRRCAFDLGGQALAGEADMRRWMAPEREGMRALAVAIAAANIVVVVVSAGARSEAAGIVAEACRGEGVRMTAVLVNAAGHGGPAVAASLAPLRAGAAMVVVADDDGYVDDMLEALRA